MSETSPNATTIVPEFLSRLSNNPESRLAAIVAYFRQNRMPVELFEALKMQSRLRLGMPMVPDPDEINRTGTGNDATRERELEDGLLDACRQSGAMMIQDGRIMEGWMYLRPTGDLELTKRLLESIEITEENYDDMVQVLLHEGVDLARGYRAVLEHQGTCNSITLFDQAIAMRPRHDRVAAATELLHHFYDELWSLVQDDFRSRGPKHLSGDAGHSDSIEAELAGSDLGKLICRHAWILGSGGYHLDTTHLSSTVRQATVLEKRSDLDLAVQLCEYGKRLPADF
ncbi:MAG: hypothetical protein AAF539_07915, partial [Planctomycetota bacterium]